MAFAADEPAAMRAESRDLDSDGQDEVLLDNALMRLVVTPAQGGRLREWVYQPGGPGTERNLFAAEASDLIEDGNGAALRLAVEGQQPEIQSGLGPAPPSGLTDHFLPLTTRFRDFAAGRARDLGDGDTDAFQPQLYEMGRSWELLMERESGLRAGKRLAPLRLIKKISLGPGSPNLAIHYRIENHSERPMQVYFAVDWTLALDAAANKGHGGRGYYEIDGVPEPGTGGFGASGAAPNVTAVALVEPQPGVTVRLGWDRAALLWVCPYPAARHGESVRGACVMPVWELRLAPDDNWAVGLWALLSPPAPPAPLPPGLVERIARTEWDDEPWRIGSSA
jgi:hypothetical protein